MAADPYPSRDALVGRLRAAGCVFAEQEAELLRTAARSAAELELLTTRRISGQPLEYVLGWAEFAGRRLHVEPGVFVPRRRTEFLARTAIRLIRSVPRPIVLDLCCGAGAIAATIMAARPDAQLSAVDIDLAAVRCARHNLAAVATAHVYAGDLFEPLPPALRGQLRLITANAPYVPTAELELMPREARDHERPATLNGGPDGLDLHRRIAAAAQTWLAPAGQLIIEVGRPQVTAAVRLMRDAGLTARVITDADADATVIIGSAPGTAPGIVPGTAFGGGAKIRTGDGPAPAS